MPLCDEVIYINQETGKAMIYLSSVVSNSETDVTDLKISFSHW